MPFRRIIATLCCVSTLAIGAAPAVSADPARPTNYRSRVERVTPATSAIEIKVVGGDGFLDLDVKRGHTATVEGYSGEPWLQIRADGTVRENQRSQATYLNQNRYGKAPTPASAQDPVAATKHPVWKVIGRSGSYIWHDHRIHYMTPSIPPKLVPGTNRVLISDRTDGRWVVPMTVDGRATQVIGDLELFTPPITAIAWGIAAVVLLVLVALMLRWRDTTDTVLAAAVILVSGLALWSGLGELAVVPRAAGSNPIAVALPALAGMVALASLVLRNAASRAIALLVSAAALGAWGMLRVPSFGKALPLTNLSPSLGRAIPAAVLGVAVATIIGAIISGGLSLPKLDLDLDDEGAGDGNAVESPTESAEGTDH